ncbi:MAG: filamentous hemagglutinin N-terminal domain-containing protein [Oscillatoria princeps RMCB-10]|jgi:filamentous hemagglutinin family protein|nr:filamentous hemagglutinin N-terminal domain-containing protein [Oscillatoria princeps RMCB-10]
MNPRGWIRHDWRLWWASCLAIGFALRAEAIANAQAIPDATLGKENSVLTPNVNINGLPSDRIDGGAIRGANLFHSFQEFNVGEAGGVYFSNPAGIANILMRVTGGNHSRILGTLGVLGSADLFLINPNGIVFGPNARLDLNGSFIASSARGIKFADGTEFSATSTPTLPLLTVSVPVGLQLGPNPGSVVNQSAATTVGQDGTEAKVGLQVQPGRTLALVGGDLTLEGGSLTAPEGRIILASAGGSSAVSLSPTSGGWALGYEAVRNFQDIHLSGGAMVNASGSGGGAIQVRGRRVTLTEGSQIVSNSSSRSGNPVTVTASESVELSGYPTGIHTFTSGNTGSAGDVSIQTGSLTIRSGGAIESSVASGAGQGGNLTVSATESAELIGLSPDGLSSSALFAQVYPDAKGTAGNLTVETRRLTVRDGAQVNASTAGEGRAGNLTVRASESVELTGTGTADDIFPSGLFAQVFPDAKGSGGNLTVETRRLTVRDGATVDATTFGAGRAGNLRVAAADSVELIASSPNAQFGGSIRAQVDTGAAGNGGSLIIETRQLTVRGGGQIASSTLGAGDAGTVTVSASDSIDLSGAIPQADLIRGSSGVFVSAEPGATGNVGGMTIVTPRLTVSDGARISADNFGTGLGGNATLNLGQLLIRNGGTVRAGSFGYGSGGTLNVSASQSVLVTGSGTLGSQPIKSSLFTQAEAGGNAGALTIATGNLTVADGAKITVASLGSGSAGDLNISARSIHLENQGKLTADSTAGLGNINIQTQNAILRGGSGITTNSQGSDPGGNITITTDNLVALENSDITANAKNSFGGQVRISASGIFGTDYRKQPTPASDITATSDLGASFSGTVSINTPDADPSAGLLALPADVVDLARLIVSGCERYKGSSFTVTGRGGIPPSPDALLAAEQVIVDLRMPGEEHSSTGRGVPATAQNNQSPIQNPQSKIQNPHGAPGTGHRPQSQQSPVPDAQFPMPTPLVEAQGWVIGPNGEVILTADAPAGIPGSPWLAPPECRSGTRPARDTQGRLSNSPTPTSYFIGNW